MTERIEIIELDRVEAAFEPFDWSFTRERADDIETIWQRETAAKPRLFNGRVLIQHRGVLDARVFRAAYGDVAYKDFIAWHRLGYPPPAVRNGFAMAALRASDGAFLLGEMASHTVNAGKIYFSAGTPDLEDVKDNRVDLAGNVLRELGEETGLTPADFHVDDRWTMVMLSTRIAFMRPVQIDLPAEEARALMLDRMKSLEDDELADIHIIRSVADLDETRMPPFQIAYLRHMLGG